MDLNFKGAIFDLDGTLIDSMNVWRDIDIKFFEKRSLPIDEEFFRAFSAMNFDQAAEFVITSFNLNEKPEDIIKEWFDMALFEYSNNIKLKPHAFEYLHYLKENGVKIALATASDKRLYEAVLKNNGIYDFFDAFVSTSQVKRGKGFPDVYFLACEKLGLEPSLCVVFEDILPGVRGAKMGNMRVVAVYDKSAFKDEEKLKSESDFYITDFLELIEK